MISTFHKNQLKKLTAILTPMDKIFIIPEAITRTIVIKKQRSQPTKTCNKRTKRYFFAQLLFFFAALF